MCGRRAPLAHAVFYAAKRAYAIKGISSFCVLEEKYLKSCAPEGGEAFGRTPVGLVSALTFIYKRQSCRPCRFTDFPGLKDRSYRRCGDKQH